MCGGCACYSRQPTGYHPDTIAMRSPQFTLKTLLWLMAVLAVTFWVTTMLQPPESYGAALMVVGTAVGWLAGTNKNHALFGALVGFFLVGPLMIACCCAGIMLLELWVASQGLD